MHPGNPPHRGDRGTSLGMMLTAVSLGFFLLVLIFISGGFFFYVLLITLGLFGVALFHYVVWGRAMTQEVAGEREEEQLRQRALADDLDDDWQPPDRHGIRRP
jgi:hypothetical protein